MSHRFDPSYARPPAEERCVVCGLPRDDRVHRLSGRQQTMAALELANCARIAGAAIKADVREGKLPVTAAIYDLRANSLNVEDLLASAPGMSRVGARMICDQLYISPIRKVKNLTDDERRQLVSRLTRRTAA